MKLLHIAILATGLLLTGTAWAQTSAPPSGSITYETMRRFDRSNARVNVNGQEVRQGGTLPNGQTFNMPETMEGTETYRFAGHWAMREPVDRRAMMGAMRGAFGRNGGGNGPGGPGGDGGPGGGTPPDVAQAPSANQMRRWNNMRFPMQETTHTDLSTGKTYQITALTPDSTHKEFYQTEQMATRPADWSVSGKTKKILGYTCQKATCTVKDQPCTVWFTTDLPFTFSPAPNFTPDKGVVLLIESDDLMYRATKVAGGSVDEASLKPDASAKSVTRDELNEVRRKAMASFRQQNGMQAPNRN